MAIGITGAGGQLGSGVLRYASERASPNEIVAITRHPEKVEAVAKKGVRVRRGDFADPSTLPSAFEGLERLLIIPLPDLVPGVRPPLHKQAIEAAVRAGVRRIVDISTVGARAGSRDGILETHFATEQAVIASGASWAFLRMGPYTGFLLNGVNAALESGTYAAVDGAPSASVVRDDVAAAGAGLLTASGYEGATLHATGPASVTHAQIADIVSRSAGRPIRYSPLTIEQFEANLRSAGLPPPVIDVLSRFQAAARDGCFDLVTHDVERLSGRPAESVESFLTRTLKAASGRG